MVPDLWVLTVAPGHRVAEALDLFESLGTPIDKRVVVTTQPDPIHVFPGNLFTYPGTDINISKWWTIGLDWIASHYGPDDVWDILVTETDARMTASDVAKVRTWMRHYNCVQAGADWYNVTDGKHPVIRRDNSAWTPPEWAILPEGRICGVASVVAGETGIRHDPAFRWWLADDDYEWQHRINGGTIVVPETTVYHIGTQGPLTGERLQAWEEDQIKFKLKWEGVPAEGGVHA